jgi:hypothetical protein
MPIAQVPLPLGPLNADGCTIKRSGIRWLCDEGQLCEPGEVVAYCNISVVRRGQPTTESDPFGVEVRDLQVAFAPRIGGRLHKSKHSSHGGFLDLHPDYHFWHPGFVIGHMECDAGEIGLDQGTPILRPVFLAGRRRTELAEIRQGLLTGWHERSRAWWGAGTSGFSSVLSLGVCEQAGIIRGEKHAFFELFQALKGPVQFVHVPDTPLVPSARVVLEQYLRGKEENEAIAADFSRTFATGPILPTPRDWIFAATLIAALQQSPLTESYDMLTRNGLFRTGPAAAVILSLNAEAPMIMRHKRLGYSVKLHRFRLMEASPVIQHWLRTEFEPEYRRIDTIRRDYETLFEGIRKTSNVKFILFNVVSTAGEEDIVSYAPYEKPMGNLLTSIRAKELNVMAHELSRSHGVAIVDLDAIAAEIGAADNIPDTIHASGLMNTETRAELLRILRDLRIPGCDTVRSENLELHGEGV